MRIYEEKITPKYIRIYDWVHDQIRQGRYKEGDKIPTEPELAERFSASRMTVRKAIDPLVLEGMLERRPGQGTFVVSTGVIKRVYDASKPMRFSHDMKALGIEHRFEVIHQGVYPADPNVARYLRLAKGEQVIKLDIVLYAEKKPVIIEINYFPYSIFRGMEEMEIDIPPLELVADKFNMHVKKVRQYISAVVAGKKEMALFKLDFPIPCIYLEWITCDQDGLPFGVSLCHYRGDAFKFKIPASELVMPDTI